MILGWLIWLGGIFTYLSISSVWTLFLAQFLTAVGNSVADPVFDQELADHTDRGLEEKEWGFFEGGKGILDGLAAIIGATVVSFFGFPVLIYIMIVTATTSFILILIYVRNLRLQKARVRVGA